ncbi:DUF559 domain-containing protein [Mycolicibacterium flavescens]|uniref:DUF559 domain-containing protein n=1 Tax=Mycolicibacterium flavescens TaxID=1776 RepID=A0A1E3RF52_MYCFV|nr:DUF559 domain-containing protein [Mycolicibacterium flavescens]MCV7278752.1 DUF559 domain-containing protein [Mycolicibacterium flavescens]ODQ88498.1 hypothetical protein BHQ18_18645 [Mycolicibacterium flavescens]
MRSDQPFLGTEALTSRLFGPRTLLSRNDRIYRDVYLSKDAELTASSRAVAAWLWSGRQATMGGLSAAALYETEWIDKHLPAEMFRRNGKPTRGILIHRDELLDHEVTSARGIKLTTPARTAFDLGRWGPYVEAVTRLDALGRATGLAPAAVGNVIEDHPGVRGLVQLRRALAVMDTGAESPQETRTRLVLIEGGLPRPQTQICVDIWRIDMGYEEFKVGVEYDGAQHWTDPFIRAKDIERQAQLQARGWLIIRVSAEMLRFRPHVILMRVCQALHQAGAEWPVVAQILEDLAA